MQANKQPYERVQLPLRRMLLNNLLGGIVWGVGSVIGATIIVALIGYLIATFQEVPFIGDVITVIQRKIPR